MIEFPVGGTSGKFKRVRYGLLLYCRVMGTLQVRLLLHHGESFLKMRWIMEVLVEQCYSPFLIVAIKQKGTYRRG